MKGQEDTICIFFRRYPDAWKNVKEAFYQHMSEDIKPATYNISIDLVMMERKSEEITHPS